MLRIVTLYFITMVMFAGVNSAVAAGCTYRKKNELMHYGAFGDLHIFKPKAEVNKVIICISGDNGWNEEIESIAFKVKDENTLVIGIDIRPYLKSINESKNSCLYPASDFEEMSQFVQKQLGYRTYITPILLGYSSGATLEYGLLAQAPQNTFKGGIAFAFCPYLAIKKPLYSGSGKFTCSKRTDNKGYDIGPSPNMTVPFICIQGTYDYHSIVAFLKHVPKAEVISLQNAGHNYSIEKDWVPQFKQAFNHLLFITADHISTTDAQMKIDLPIQETEPNKPSTGNSMVIMISGDGGWTGFDQEIANEFADQGMPVVGLNSLKYFWEKKTPQQATLDVQTLIEKYSALWKKSNILLVGYSFGADVMPFIYNRLPEDIRSHVKSIGLLSPSKDTDFEVHVTDLLNFSSSQREFSVPAEIDKIKDIHLVCFFGKDEEDVPAKELSANCKIVYLQGGHHYENSFSVIYQNIVKQ